MFWNGRDQEGRLRLGKVTQLVPLDMLRVEVRLYALSQCALPTLNCNPRGNESAFMPTGARFCQDH